MSQQNCIFSEEAKNIISTKYPELSSDSPMFNIRFEVSLLIGKLFEKEKKQEDPHIVYVQRVEDMTKEIVDAATFVGDMWLENDLPNLDYISNNDLIGAEVSVSGSDTVFFVLFDLRTKATPLKK